MTKDTEVRDYLFMYERIIPRMLQELDPDTFYCGQVPRRFLSHKPKHLYLGEMYITGKYGMEINHFLSIENISSGMLQIL